MNDSPKIYSDLTEAPVALEMLSPQGLAALGDGQIAYVRPIRSDDLKRLFPQAPEIQPGLDLFALLGADGSPLMITDSRAAAIANAWEHDLMPVSVH
ncbi:MAG: DUF1150 family protein [Alsobacter sp.]